MTFLHMMIQDDTGHGSKWTDSTYKPFYNIGMRYNILINQNLTNKKIAILYFEVPPSSVHLELLIGCRNKLTLCTEREKI